MKLEAWALKFWAFFHSLLPPRRPPFEIGHFGAVNMSQTFKLIRFLSGLQLEAYFRARKKQANPPGWLQRLRNITISVVRNLKILELSSWSKPNSLSLSPGFQSHARAELWICLKTWPSLLFKSSRNDFLKALIMSKLLSRRQFKRFDPFLGGILKRQLSFC